ncbi:MAG: phage portal protein [Pseudomonadota bacterium]
MVSAVNLIAASAASLEWLVYQPTNNGIRELEQHPLKSLLTHPHPNGCGNDFFTTLYSQLLLAGNAYINCHKVEGEVKELYLLPPNQMSITPGPNYLPLGYVYQAGGNSQEFAVDQISGYCKIIHLKIFNPQDQNYGLSPIAAASRSIDQHNQAAIWNQSLLQNSARPSGALVMNANNQMGGHLTPDQYTRLRQQIDEQFSGHRQSGRPLVLEGGLSWQEMGMSSRDMDFIEAKNMAAREIALAFGVPPQLLGIPGDNTYSNLQEARLSLWEETIFPLVDNIKKIISSYFSHYYQQQLQRDYDKDKISALAIRRERLWNKVNQANFLTEAEKREAVGYKSHKK